MYLSGLPNGALIKREREFDRAASRLKAGCGQDCQAGLRAPSGTLEEASRII